MCVRVCILNHRACGLLVFSIRGTDIPFDGRANNLDERKCDLRVPLIGGLENEVVERLADLGILAVVSVREVDCEHNKQQCDVCKTRAGVWAVWSDGAVDSAHMSWRDAPNSRACARG